MSQVNIATQTEVKSEVKNVVPRDLILINRSRAARGKDRLMSHNEYIVLGQKSGQRGIETQVMREQKDTLYFLVTRFGLPSNWDGAKLAEKCGIGATRVFDSDVDFDKTA